MDFVLVAALGTAVVTILAIVLLLLHRIAFPTILRHPWPAPKPGDRNKMVVMAGSFNPPHKGHVAMLQYLSQRCVYNCYYWNTRVSN